mmetsp:Transcript_24435/g.55081  ORF Transcript_24435/g.55081 Transcript_24435/m.55081 type:complete len:229 (+) Transcript_24435:10170-10856(+)
MVPNAVSDGGYLNEEDSVLVCRLGCHVSTSSRHEETEARLQGSVRVGEGPALHTLAGRLLDSDEVTKPQLLEVVFIVWRRLDGKPGLNAELSSWQTLRDSVQVVSEVEPSVQVVVELHPREKAVACNERPEVDLISLHVPVHGHHLVPPPVLAVADRSRANTSPLAQRAWKNERARLACQVSQSSELHIRRILLSASRADGHRPGGKRRAVLVIDSKLVPGDATAIHL